MLTIVIYERIGDVGPRFVCMPLVNDRQRMTFSGDDAAEVEQRARAWYARHFEPRPAPKPARSEPGDGVFG